MWTNWRRGVFMLAFFAAGVSGCRRGEIAPEPEPEAVIHLGDKTEIVLADWLKLPRATLAEMVKVTHDAALKQQETARDSQGETALLPKFRSVVDAPVFGKARFSEQRGCSVPEYVADGAFDADVARHLARYGDHEGALKFADPADADLRKQLDALRTEKNYPAEWTQLVGLRLQLAQLKMAFGQADDSLEGATELVLLHRQLVELLDTKAAAGPLGAALLPVGRTVLAEAAGAWREEATKKPALADDIDAALKNWGAFLPSGPAVQPGAKGAAVARLMGAEVHGRTIAAKVPNAVSRSLDLLSLPLVHESVENVVAFLDADGKLAEFLVIYKEGTKHTFPEPSDLARPLLDLDFTKSAGKAGELPRLSLTGGGLIFDVTTTAGRSSTLGAFIRVGAARAAAATVATKDPRDFGGLNLDRSFERNRTGVAPEATPDKKFQVTRAAALERVTLPVTDPRPSLAVVDRKGENDLVESITFRWSAANDLNLVAVPKLVVPLWEAYGPARIEGMGNTKDGHLAFTWESDKTRMTLRLPYESSGAPSLVVVDRRGDDAVKERLAVTAKFDKDERDARWKAEKPVARLGRSLPGIGVEDVQLGQSRAEVQKALALVPETRLVALADGGFNVVYFSTPAAGATFWPRQLFVRFDKDGHVAEIRARYQDSGTPTRDRPALLDVLKRTDGAPEKVAPTWPGVWADLHGTHTATHFRWLDDCTLATFQRDSVTTEVTLRDCSAEAPLGVDVPPLSFCSRGVKGCELGDKRSEVLKTWKITKPQMVGDALLLAAASGPFDAVLVYFEDGDDGRVVKVIGQYRNRLQGSDVTQAINEAWRDDLDHLGAVRRQETGKLPMLQAWSWHDDRTRVRLFGQLTDSGPRLYCEWRDLPITAGVKTVKR